MTRWPPGDPRARRTDPQTSHDAASSVGDPTKSQASVLMVMRQLGDCTDEELVKGYMNLLTSPYWTRSITVQSESGIRTRRHELTERGLVVDTNARRKLESGRLGTVWRAREGREIAAESGALGRIIQEMNEEAERNRTEGALFDPDDGKPDRRHGYDG